MIQVKKANGQTAAFDKSKIVRILGRVGVSSDEANRLAGQIESWAQTVPGGTVNSQEIKRKVLELASPEVAQKIRAFVKARREG